jgi:hypothetical protein
MLSQYKNIDQILSTNKSISGLRIDKLRSDYLSFDAAERVSPVTAIVSPDPNSNIKTELHIYSDEDWITGNHSIQLEQKIPVYYNEFDQPITWGTSPIAIDLYQEFDTLKLTSGKFKIVINFFKNLIGSYDRQHLRIDDVSPDRTEIKLRAIDSDDPEYLQQISEYINTVKHTNSTYWNTYLLNFSRNQNVTIVNSVVIGEYLYVKLDSELPLEFGLNYKCWVVQELKPAYIDNVFIAPAVAVATFNSLAGPNWQAFDSTNTSAETDYKTWSELLGSNAQTSQQIVDTYFSGSLSGMSLNIDFSDFNNFIFYSSAEERLVNFRYKMEMLDYYDAQYTIVSNISGSTATTNAQDYLNTKSNLIGGFDNWEKWLYYESSSRLTTYDNPLENPNVAELTGSYITTMPKNTSVTSSIFETWYTEVLDYAQQYDELNLNSLIKTIPEHMRLDSDNTELSTFVNMLGHHYDIIYTYVNHMQRVNKRDENPKVGMPNELLYSVAKQFGWNLQDGTQSQELWQYLYGVDSIGTSLTGSNSVLGTNTAGKDITYTTWRRIVNNLPLLLKSKGTKRSVQALLSCYGIPQSMISINEYGGPKIEGNNVYKKLNFDYALNFSGSSGQVSVPYNQSINSIELRFRTPDITLEPTLPASMELFRVGNVTASLEFERGTLGRVSINGNTSNLIELYDGTWNSVLVRTNGSNVDLVAKKAKYGNIIATATASANTAISASSTVIIGAGTRFIGQVQELRLWSSSLQDSAFENHTKAPAAYDGNIEAYDELIFRLPLTQKIITGSFSGVQPVINSITASINGNLSGSWDSIEEMYYYDAVTLAGTGFNDNKIRLEQNDLVGSLDIITRAERSQYDSAALDSKKLGIYFSPQTMIDEDIIAHLGGIELDDYIGDPVIDAEMDYPRLILRAQQYWKKYDTSNDFNAYISMFTLFDMSFFKQLEQLLPARTDKLTGLLIQPNLLERNRESIQAKISHTTPTYDSNIDLQIQSITGSVHQYLGEVATKIVDIIGEYPSNLSVQLKPIASASVGTVYSKKYLLNNNITGSSPYWLSEAVCPAIFNSTTSEKYYVSGSSPFINTTGAVTLYGSSTYGVSLYSNLLTVSSSGTYAPVQDFLPIGIENQKYAGAKMTSPAFNVNSLDTIDGGPVVEWFTANPNQLIVGSGGNQGVFQLNNG